MRRQLGIGRSTFALGWIAALAMFATTAAAAPISMDITSGKDNGFRFSVLHTANGSGSGFAMSGSTSSNLTGSLVGDYDGVGKITGLTGVLSAKVGSHGLRDRINTWSGGAFAAGDMIDFKVTDGGFADFGPNAGGYLDYELFVAGTLVHDGVFFFYDKTHLSGPDPDANDMKIGQVPGRDFSFWGNNFKNTAVDWTNVLTALGKGVTFGDEFTGVAGTVAGQVGQLRLGMDLGGQTTQPVPEPGSLVLIGLGVAGLAIARRRRRKLS